MAGPGAEPAAGATGSSPCCSHSVSNGTERAALVPWSAPPLPAGHGARNRFRLPFRWPIARPLVPSAGYGGRPLRAKRACTCYPPAPARPRASRGLKPLRREGRLAALASPAWERCKRGGQGHLRVENLLPARSGLPCPASAPSGRARHAGQILRSISVVNVPANMCTPVPKVAAGVLFAGQPRRSRHSLLPIIRADSCANRSTRRIGT
jgi:hypothetical protein